MSQRCRWWNSQRKWTLSFAISCLRLPSRLSKCPSLLFLFVLFFARLFLCRSWWNSWWKCRLCCLLPFSSSGLPRKSLVFLFLTVVEKVLMEVFKASPRDRALQRFVVQKTSTLLFLTVVEEVLVEVFKASPRDRAQQRVMELNMLTLLFLTVVEEVLVEVFKASPRDRALQRFVVQKTSTYLFLTVVEEVLVEVFKASPRDRAQTAICGAENVDTPVSSRSWRRCFVEVFKASPRDQGSTAICGAENVDTPVPHGRGGGPRGGLQGLS